MNLSPPDRQSNACAAMLVGESRRETCIDLVALFGDRFRIVHDPAYAAEHGEHGRADDPWLKIIPCQFGHVYPQGGNMLAFSTNGRGSTTKRLLALPFVRVAQDASDGVNIIFPVDRFDEVAQIARPKRKRPPMSDENRAAARERLARFQFSAAEN